MRDSFQGFFKYFPRRIKWTAKDDKKMKNCFGYYIFQCTGETHITCLQFRQFWNGLDIKTANSKTNTETHASSFVISYLNKKTLLVALSTFCDNV